METLVECVPNFSEGRDDAIVQAIAEAVLAGPDVYLLDRHLDADHNRSVLTFVGSAESVGPAALRGIAKAAELIDLTRHQGAHPRLGATDVVPFVPIAGVTLDDCVRIAVWVAEQAWSQFGIPTYLYAAAARKPERAHLENIRRGQFEGAREEIRSNAARLPDFGDAALHPTAGATVVGARKFLIAYNINLNTPDVAAAKAIAKKIRASSGGLPCVKAIGLELKTRKVAQVSMNLADFETTSVATVFNAVSSEATALGVKAVSSEIVGLIPRQALIGAAAELLRVENFTPGMVVENRLESAMGTAVTWRDRAEPPQNLVPAHLSDEGTSPLRAMVEQFVATVAAPNPAAAGGSVAALSGALAAALGEMVCGVSLKRKSLAPHHAALELARKSLSTARERLMEIIDLDARSYDALLQARKLPATTPEEQTARDEAISKASKQACLMPLETAEVAAEVKRQIAGLAAITIEQAAADLSVASNLADTAQRAGIENLHANLSGVQDESWRRDVEVRLAALNAGTGSGPDVK